MSGLYNQTTDLDVLMPECGDAFEELFHCRSFEERIAWMESYLLGIFNPKVRKRIYIILSQTCCGHRAGP